MRTPIWRWAGWLGLLLLVGTPALGDSPQRPAPPVAMEEIRRLVHAQNDRLVSLEAEFRSWHRSNAGTPRHEHYFIAATAGRRYHHLWHGEYADPAADPRGFVQLLDGEHWNVLNTYFRRYDVSRELAVRPYTDKILFHPFFEGLGWWPPGGGEAPRRAGRRIFLADLLDDDRCRVVGRELVEGAWCQVVEVPGLERAWVDRDRGVVPRRTFLGGAGEHPEIAIYEASDFREVAGGLFLPYRLHRTQRASGLDITTVVERYEVNRVGDDRFRLAVAPGTLVYDRDTDTFRQEPGGFSLMERLTGWVRERCPRVERSDRSLAGNLAAWGLGGFAVGALTAGLRSPRRARPVAAVRPT